MSTKINDKGLNWVIVYRDINIRNDCISQLELHK